MYNNHTIFLSHHIQTITGHCLGGLVCAPYYRCVLYWYFLLCTNPQIINVEVVKRYIYIYRERERERERERSGRGGGHGGREGVECREVRRECDKHVEYYVFASIGDLQVTLMVALAELSPLDVHLRIVPLSLDIKGPNTYVDTEPEFALDIRPSASGELLNDSKLSCSGL